MSLQDIHDIYAEPHIKSFEIKVSDGSTLGNKDIVTEKFELQDSLNSGHEIIFGSCEAACLKLQIATADKEYKGLWLDVWATIQDDSGDLMIDDEHFLLLSDGQKLRMQPYLHSQMIGRFKVVLDEPVSDRSWRNLTCYDQMYDVLRAEVADWYTGLTFPMTIKQLRDSFFTYLGIEQETVTLINDSLSVKGDFVATSKLTGRSIIKAICELNGVFGHMNADGKMDYISIPSAEDVEYAYYRDGTGTYERDVVEPITGIIARDSEDDAGTTVGTTDNVYIITGNPLVYGIEGTPALTSALNALLTKISAVTYRPFTVQAYGNPCLPIGTSITLNTRDMVVQSFIESRRLTGVQALKDNISAKGEKERLNDTIDLSSELYQTDGRYHLLRNDVNGLESEVFDEDGNSVIEQISNEIVLKVDSNGKIVNVELTAEPTGSAFKIVADNIDFISNDVMNLYAKNIGIQANNFKLDKTTGLMECKGGTIGGFTIDTSNLYNGMTSFSDTTHNGVYVGTDGVALGKGAFKVSNSGELTCSKASISNSESASSNTSDFSITPQNIYIRRSSTSGETYTSTLMYSGYTNRYVNNNSNYSISVSGGAILFNRNSTSYTFVTNTGSDKIYLGESGSSNTDIKQIWCTNLTVYGTKSRGVETKDYGGRLLYCYEMPTPMFGDVGEGKIAEDGKCYVRTDSTFNQTIADGSYQVFLQKYGQGECYVTERRADYFVVEGTAGMKFGFEIKAKQAGYENLRLETERNTPQINEYYFGTYELNQDDYGQMAVEHIEEIAEEREVA